MDEIDFKKRLHPTVEQYFDGEDYLILDSSSGSSPEVKSEAKSTKYGRNRRTFLSWGGLLLEVEIRSAKQKIDSSR